MSNPLSSFIAFLKGRIGALHDDFGPAEQHLSDALKAETDAVEARLEAKFASWKAEVLADVEAKLAGTAEKVAPSAA